MRSGGGSATLGASPSATIGLPVRTRLPLAMLLSGALLLSACGDDGDGGDAATDAATDTATDAPTAAGTDAPTDQPTQAELVSEDLPDGIAATVGDTEIPVEVLQARLDAMRQIPQVQEQLESEEGGEQLESQLQTQALSQLVLQEVVLQGAAEQDVEVGDDEVEDYRTELAENAGGDEAFDEQLATAGVPGDQLDQELRASLAFEMVTEKLLSDAGVEPTEPATEEGMPPGQDPQTQQVQQEWLAQLVSDTDVVVDEEYGAWDATSGQVVAA